MIRVQKPKQDTGRAERGNMNKLIVLIAFVLTGCMSVPVKQNFPEVPPALMEKCSELNKLSGEVKLSDVAKSVVENYTLYHECSIKNEAWIEWYRIQKEIHDKIK